MIAAIYGTTGELIKLAPLLRALEERGQPALTACTGQQVEQVPTMLRDFGLRQPDIWIARGYAGGDLERPPEIPRWLFDVVRGFAGRRRELRERLRGADTRPAVLVHGDTFTTLLGTLMGRLLRLPVAHVEAGMRSGTLRTPFPEEFNRRAVARLAAIHFAPGRRPVANLQRERVRGEIVDTLRNTIVDNLPLIPDRPPPGVEVGEGPFGLVSLHRFELIERREPFRAVLELLREASRGRRLLFIDHPTTAAAIESDGLGPLFDGERFVRIPRQRYFHFLALLKLSDFLVTDSGGSQEECAYLGHPCVIHRSLTEHDTGLDGSVLLSRMDLKAVSDFLAEPKRWRRPPVPVTESPTRCVLEHLEQGGFIRGPDGYASPMPSAALPSEGRA